MKIKTISILITLTYKASSQWNKTAIIGFTLPNQARKQIFRRPINLIRTLSLLLKGAWRKNITLSKNNSNQ